MIGPNSYDSRDYGAAVSELHWAIDATSMVMPVVDNSALASQGGSSVVPATSEEEWATRDKGYPGDVYRVKLMVAGGYRAICWKKESSGTEDDKKEAMASGKYYLTGPFNNWDFTRMEASEKTPGLFFLKVPAGIFRSIDFQVVRNKDFDQIFVPPEPTGPAPSASETQAVRDPTGAHNYWQIACSPMETFQVEFTRTSENGGSLSWVLV